MELRFNGTFNGSIPGALISARTQGSSKLGFSKNKTEQKKKPHTKIDASIRVQQRGCWRDP